jgi:hypothetical protein
MPRDSSPRLLLLVVAKAVNVDGDGGVGGPADFVGVEDGRAVEGFLISDMG